jgi:hypothetical protein
MEYNVIQCSQTRKFIRYQTITCCFLLVPPFAFQESRAALQFDLLLNKKGKVGFFWVSSVQALKRLSGVFEQRVINRGIHLYVVDSDSSLGC